MTDILIYALAGGMAVGSIYLLSSGILEMVRRRRAAREQENSRR